ncbi:40S ribosomal protein S21-2 [Hibiscus syriacus]|uniref:40S ribosomal protein S21-2 n=1 Tax=Hibiscus syriacus TaxID=106335 RepID=A0A6A2WL67_HIBSY|nr:40S ribosomal protein S21-2 [Hibiscus syriacus]
MATAEGKPETKQEPKPETKEVEENQEPPLKYKAWVLKVSIHCEGCKRKVEKTLRNIEGVYEAYADSKQQRAAVKANLHVNAETLVKKLVNKGRHAELWPEKSEPEEKTKGKPKNKDKQGGQSEKANSNSSKNGGDKEKEAVKNEDDGGKMSENGGSSKVVAEVKQNVTHDRVKEPKPGVKQNVTVATGDQSSVTKKKSGGGNIDGAAGGEGDVIDAEKSGSGSKKDKKKGQKANANVDDRGDGVPATVGSHLKGLGPHCTVHMPSPTNQSPPRQHPMYECPTYYHEPPLYLTSYNTAYPSSSHGASYYTVPPQYSYSYMHRATRANVHRRIRAHTHHIHRIHPIRRIHSRRSATKTRMHVRSCDV